MITQRAYGLDCATSVAGAARATPFIVLDLAGGHNIPGGNVMVGKDGNQSNFLANYATLGIAPSAAPSIAGNVVALNGDVNNSLLFHASSQFLAGMKSVSATPTFMNNMDGVVFCTTSNDDSGGNPHNPSYWINKAGLTGALVQLVGNKNSDSGGNAAAPLTSLNPANRPVLMSTPASTSSLVDLGLLGSAPLNSIKAEKVLKAISGMSQTQVAKFSEKELSQQTKDLVSCGYINSAAMISKYGPAALTPVTDVAFTDTTKGFKGNFAGANASSSAVAKLVLDGLAGAGTITMGGYDYHGQGLATQATKDFAAGVQAGQLFQTAELKQTPLIMYWYTDGGVAAQAANEVGGRYPFVSDNGERSSAVMMIYDPKGKPKIRNGVRQVGSFNDSGAVDDKATIISGNVEVLTKLITANYLALTGREGELAKIVGDNLFGADLEKMLSFSVDTLAK
jgi:hypothetical protein